MLEKEKSDIDKARQHALSDADEAFEDLEERMQDFYDAKEEELEDEADKVIRALQRAVRDKKPLD